MKSNNKKNNELLKNKKFILLCGIILVLIIGSIVIASTNGNKEKNNKGFIYYNTTIESNEVLDAEVEDNEIIEEVVQEENKIKEEITEQKITSTYYIKVNYQANVVTVYKNSDGNLTPIKAMICSTGDYTPPCGKYPSTVYKLPGTRWEWGALQGNVYGHYVTKIVGNILFHSVPYTAANPGALEYWEYDKLGTSASAGCVRLKIADSKWIYDNMPAGTIVEFYADSNPGPLGNPGVQKISGNEKCRNWDPTDPNPNNPWNGYKEPEQEKPKEEKKEELKKEENKTKRETNNIGEKNTSEVKTTNAVNMTNTNIVNNTIENTTNNNTTNNSSSNTTSNNTSSENTSTQNSTTVETNTTNIVSNNEIP